MPSAFVDHSLIWGGSMNSRNKITLRLLAFCMVLAMGTAPALSKAQASSSDSNPAAAKPAAGNSGATSASQAAPVSSATATPKAAGKSVGGAASDSEIAAAKASGKVWVNTESRVYHKSGRWYGKTKAGKFMTEPEAKAAGYKAAHKE
jgi:hypothetical protein